MNAHISIGPKSDILRRRGWGCRRGHSPPKGVSEAVFQVKQSSSFCHPLRDRDKNTLKYEVPSYLALGISGFWAQLLQTGRSGVCERRRSGADRNKRPLTVGM